MRRSKQSFWNFAAVAGLMRCHPSAKNSIPGMGVVKRQSIKQSIVAYIALAAGALNSLILFPAALDADQIGLINVIKEAAFVFMPVAFLGGVELVVRFFPVFRDEERGHRGFLFFLVGLVTAGMLLLCALFFPFRHTIIEFYSDRSELFRHYLPYLLPLTALLSFATMLSLYVSNFKRIVLPAIFNELMTKAGLSVLILLLLGGLISFHALFNAYMGLFALALLGLLWYAASLGQLHLLPDFSLFKKPLMRDMASFSLYGLIGNFSYGLAHRIDLMMLASLSTLTQTGVYSIAFFIANTFEIPRKAISRVASPLLAEHWQTDKKDEIQSLYRKSALNQLIFGIGLFIAIWVSVDDLYRLMPNGDLYRSGKYVILILSIARIFDLATGLNSEIISYSRFYRYNLYLFAIPVVISIVGNYLLIPRFDMIGAALAVMIASVFYNISKFVLIKWKFGMDPFNRQFLLVLLCGVLACLIGLVLPSTPFPLLGIALKSGVTLALFGLLVWKSDLSPEVSQLANDIFHRLFNRKKS